MNVGDTSDGRGILGLLLEVLANAFDQHIVGRCSRASIDLAADGTITIADDGPGIPASAFETILEQRSTKPTVDGHRPHVHLGFGGIGMFVTNALSERFELRTVHDGVEATVVYARGIAVEPLATSPATRASGTHVRFRPDPTIFSHLRIPRVELARHLEDLSFLAPQFTVSLAIHGDDLARGGLAASVAIRARSAIEYVAHHALRGEIDVDVALAWHPPARGPRAPEIESFTNLTRTRTDGTHVQGLFDGVRACLGPQARKSGLVAAVAVLLPDVKFGAPDRSRLDSPEARAPVAEATRLALDAWIARHPEIAATVRKPA